MSEAQGLLAAQVAACLLVYGATLFARRVDEMVAAERELRRRCQGSQRPFRLIDDWPEDADA